MLGIMWSMCLKYRSRSCDLRREALQGWAAIHLAAYNGRSETVLALISAKADIHVAGAGWYGLGPDEQAEVEVCSHPARTIPTCSYKSQLKFALLLDCVT